MNNSHKFKITICTFVMLLGIIFIPKIYASSDIKGTIAPITAGGTASGDVVTYPTVSLSYSPANTSIGRNSDGYWVGVKLTSPTVSDTFTLDMLKNVQYKNNVDGPWKSFYTNKDGIEGTAENPTSIWMGAWGYVNEDYIVRYGDKFVYCWYFDWDKDGEVDQTFTLNFSGVKFNNVSSTHSHIYNGKALEDSFTLQIQSEDYLVEGTTDTYYYACIIDGCPSTTKTYKVVKVPTANTLTYNGNEQVGVDESEDYTIIDNKKTDAGEYTAVVSLKNAGDLWADGTTEDKEIAYTISKVKVTAPTAEESLVYNGEEQIGVKAGENYTITGNVNAKAGTYKATASLKNVNYIWNDNTSEDKEIEYTIAPIVVEVPKAETSLIYTGKYLVGVKEGEGYTIVGNSNVNAGTYEATLTLIDENYTWADNTTNPKIVKYQILPEVVEIPKAEKSLVYNGEEQVGVRADIQYVIYDNVKTDAGTYEAKLALINGNYVWSDETTTDKKVTYVINKALPKYDIPTDLMGIVGNKLSTVTLPSNFTWDDEDATLEEGENVYLATYTPADKVNYHTINKIEINVKSIKVEKEVSDSNSSLAVVTDMIDDMLNNDDETTLTEEQINKIHEAIAEGKEIVVDVVTEDVQKDLVEEDAKKVEKVLKDEAKIAGYYDIDFVLKDEDGNEITKLTELKKPVKITVPVPEVDEVAEGYVRTYSIVRVHNGVAEELDTVLNDDNTLTFSTNLFSTYVVTYIDTQKSDVNSTVETGDATSSNEAIKTTNPNTGDDILLVFAMATIAATLLVVVKKNK